MENEYYELGFDERNSDQPNISEDEAWKYFTNLESWKIARWGFNEKENYKNKITKEWWYCLPKVITKSPDNIVIHRPPFITKKGFNYVYKPYFLEVKAVGKHSLKLKLEDLKYMKIWRKTKGMAGLVIFAWSCNLNEGYSGEYAYWIGLINDIKPEIKQFSDSKKDYYDIPVEKLDMPLDGTNWYEG